MYSRLLKEPIKLNKSFFLFGPRGTGKTTWLKAFKSNFPEARLFLLYGGTRNEFEDEINILPVTKALRNLSDILNKNFKV